MEENGINTNALDTDTRIVSILSAERAAALGSSTNSDLSQQRMRALDYYMSDMDEEMPAPDGRSSVVSSDVQDTIEALLPVLLDIFVSGEHVVEFQPTGAADEDSAKEETDAVNYVFHEQNDGFLTLYQFFKDALLQKNGFIKVWWEKEDDWSRETYTGLPEEAYGLLFSDGEVEIVSDKTYPGISAVTNQMGTLHDVVVRKKKTLGRARVMCVPPEECLISQSARNIRDTTYFAHVMLKPAAVVKQMFPGHDEAIDAAPSSTTVSDNAEANARQTVGDYQDMVNTTGTLNKSMRMIEVAEHYIRCDFDDDTSDKAPLWRITTVGTAPQILEKIEFDNIPFATATPIIMSHRVFGRAVADLVIEIQRMKTALLRGALDNVYLANNQRMEVPESHATDDTIDDLLNNRPGGIVRTKQPGGLMPIANQPIGDWLMGVLEYADTAKEQRTGVTRYNQGLDTDSLNKTATGIVQVMSAAEMRIKLVARVFAETGVRDTFLLLHELMQKHSDEPFEAKLGQDWVPVDPREWETRKRMRVNVAVGSGSKQQLLAVLMNILGIQQKALEMGGPQNGLVAPRNIYNTLKKLCEISGLKSVDPFFMQPPEPDPHAPPPPPKPDPEALKAQNEIAISKEKAATEQQIAQQKAQADQALAQQDLQHDMQMEQMRADHDLSIQRAKVQSEQEMARAKLGFDMELERMKFEHTAALNEQQAKIKAETGASV